MDNPWLYWFALDVSHECICLRMKIPAPLVYCLKAGNHLEESALPKRTRSSKCSVLRIFKKPLEDSSGTYEPCHEKKRLFAYVKTKALINCTVTAQLIIAFGFATSIVQSLYFLNRKFQASSHLLWPYSPVCVAPSW